MAVLPSSPPQQEEDHSPNWVWEAGYYLPGCKTYQFHQHQPYEVCGEGKETSSRPLIGRQGWTLPTSISTGLWWTGEGYYGQIRPKSTGLCQMGINGPGKRLENHYQTGLLHLLSSMEEEVLWFGAVWDGMWLGF